jgi:hypothetical protein
MIGGARGASSAMLARIGQAVPLRTPFALDCGARPGIL